jgi:hypothetical protein
VAPAARTSVYEQTVDNADERFNASASWTRGSWNSQRRGADYRYARPEAVSDTGSAYVSPAPAATKSMSGTRRGRPTRPAHQSACGPRGDTLAPSRPAYRRRAVGIARGPYPLGGRRGVGVSFHLDERCGVSSCRRRADSGAVNASVAPPAARLLPVALDWRAIVTRPRSSPLPVSPRARPGRCVAQHFDRKGASIRGEAPGTCRRHIRGAGHARP